MKTMRDSLGGRLLQMMGFPFTSWRMNMSCLLCFLLGLDHVVTTVKEIFLSCQNISTSEGYAYPVLQLDREKELLSYGRQNPDEPLHTQVVNEDANNLILSECINTSHRVTCHEIEKKLVTTYYVTNDTNHSPPIEQTSDVTASITIPIVIGAVIAVIIAMLIICYNRERRAARLNGVV